MRYGGWLVCLGLLVLPLRADDAKPAAPAAKAEIPRISVEFSKTDVKDAMKKLGELTGIDFLVSPGVSGAVTARFINEPLDKVLRLIAMTLRCEVKLVEGVFVLKPLEAKAATPAAAEGAGALLPGTAPTTALPEVAAGAKSPAADKPDSLVGPPVTGGTPTSTAKSTRTTIPVTNQPVSTISRALGVGYVDSQGQYHAPTDAPAGGADAGLGNTGGGGNDPYANLPPGARVTRNGTIMMPNGNTVLPSGLIILPNGTIIRPPAPTSLSVPYGTGVNQLPQPTVTYPGTLSGNIAGIPFGTNSNGGLSIGGTSTKIGPVTIITPGVQVGSGQTPQQPTVVLPTPTIRPGLPPTWHYGQPPVNWKYGLPPDWHFVPPGTN